MVDGNMASAFRPASLVVIAAKLPYFDSIACADSAVLWKRVGVAVLAAEQ